MCSTYLVHFFTPCSLFSRTYPWSGLPPSFTGGCHSNVMESSVVAMHSGIPVFPGTSKRQHLCHNASVFTSLISNLLLVLYIASNVQHCHCSCCWGSSLSFPYPPVINKSSIFCFDFPLIFFPSIFFHQQLFLAVSTLSTWVQSISFICFFWCVSGLFLLQYF